MNFSQLLAGWGDVFNMPESYVASKLTGEYAGQTLWDYSWMASIFNVVSIVLYIILGLAGAAGAIYAIYLGIELARADEQGKRDDAKKHLITVLIAVAVTIVLILFFNLLLPEIVKAFMGAPNIYYQDTRVYPEGTTFPVSGDAFAKPKNI